MSDHAKPQQLIRRVNATQATLDEWKKRPFRWGSADCVRVAASHLRRMGYSVKLPSSGSYRSLRTARSRLAERGYANVADALDEMGFARIAPAEALPGDIISWPSGDDVGALAVVIGNGRSLAFHADSNAAEVVQILESIAAWRIEPQ